MRGRGVVANIATRDDRMRAITRDDLEVALSREVHVDQAHGFPPDYTVAQLASLVFAALPSASLDHHMFVSNDGVVHCGCGLDKASKAAIDDINRMHEKARRWHDDGWFTDAEWGAVCAVLYVADMRHMAPEDRAKHVAAALRLAEELASTKLG